MSFAFALTAPQRQHHTGTVIYTPSNQVVSFQIYPIQLVHILSFQNPQTIPSHPPIRRLITTNSPFLNSLYIPQHSDILDYPLGSKTLAIHQEPALLWHSGRSLPLAQFVFLLLLHRVRCGVENVPICPHTSGHTQYTFF